MSPPASLTRAVRRGLLIVFCAEITIALAAWILPVEVAQNWMVARAGSDPFARFEASGAATATVWCCRGIASFAVITLFTAWLIRRKAAPWLAQAIFEFWQATTPAGADSRWRITTLRLFIASWIVLAVYHAGASVNRRIWDWPVYRLRAGKDVLPNISDNNREVIHYLTAATPPGSRTLVLSDQKLFFLSYYSLPRRLYHPTHPDSEFVIPQPYNQRQLAAYQLEDVPTERIQSLQPGFILEYFEGARYIQGRDLEADSNWVNYTRQQKRDPSWRPQYLVVLRRTSTRNVP